ncbi:unnamed protein product [Brassica oleracea]
MCVGGMSASEPFFSADLLFFFFVIFSHIICFNRRHTLI